MIEKSAEQQSGIGGEHGVIHGVEVQRAGRPEAGRQQAVVALVLQVELMRGAQGFARDLPDADGVVADHDALAATAKNDVVALSALLPDGVGQIAVNVHVVVLHGANAEKVVEWKGIELGDIKNVRGELGSLFARERAGGRVAPRENTIVGLGLENQKLGQGGEKLEGAERFQLLLRGDAVRDIEHVALLLEIVKVLLRP